MNTRRMLSVALNAALFAGSVAVVGCSQQPAPTASQQPAAAASAATGNAPATAYAPPTADQLYQMVAPISLFPDKLVAQVLAGATYPDQVTAADSFLEQNQSLHGAALQDVVDPQFWDPSVKGLTVFPKVLDQMAQNIAWTTALGNAYANDPTDVLNAIQVMRQRASTHGSLRSSAKLHVVDQPVTAVDRAYAAPPPDDGYDPRRYDGPAVVPAPQQTIEILPTDAETVYVPQYDPQTVYGGDLQPYPTYRYEEPGYSRGDIIGTGALAFGAGIVIATLYENSHRDRPSYGWNSWGMRWHGDRNQEDGHDHDGRDSRGAWQRPAVVHNNTVYVTRSTTINNRYVTNQINNSVSHSNNTSINSNNRQIINTVNRPAAALPVDAATRAVSAPPKADQERARQVRFNVPPTTPVSRPDFNGALTQGQPARFAHLGFPTAHRTGVAAAPPPPPPANLRQQRGARADASPLGSNWPEQPRDSQAAQSAAAYEPAGRHEISRALDPRGAISAPREPTHTRESRALSQLPSRPADVIAQRLPAAPRPVPHAAPAPVRQPAVVIGEHEHVQRPARLPQPAAMPPRMQRTTAVDMPRQRERPAAVDLPRQQPRPQQAQQAPRQQAAAPRPVSEQHHSDAARKDGKRENATAKNH